MTTIIRFSGILFGAFFLIISLPMMVAGIAVLTIPEVVADSDGYMNSPTFHLTSDNSYAFVTQSFTMSSYSSHNEYRYNSKFSMEMEFNNFEKIVNLRIKADSYFMGLAPTSEVEQYLGNVSFVMIKEFNDQHISTYEVNVDKNGSLSGNPNDQTFWLASGIDVLDYTPSSNDFNQELTFVLMKVDGSKGVDADVQIGVDLPILKPLGVILLIFGGMFFVLTVTCFVIAYKSKDQSKKGKYLQVGQVQSDIPVVKPSINKIDYISGSSKYCVNCGTKTEIEANFCETCGYEYIKS